VKIRDEYFRKGWLKRVRFGQFYKKNYHLSVHQYKEIDDIMNNPPIYDLYVTGSDQLWNVNTLFNDPVMYCEFAPAGKRRVAFGASFTNRELPSQYEDSVRVRLNKYSHIGVREHTSLAILDSLKLDSHIIKANTCDPTLLLDAKDYMTLANQSKVHINGSYVLVYVLKYAFNPEPALSAIVDEIRQKMGLKLVVIDGHKVKMVEDDCVISGIGPNEFCWLFAHAKFVIASSFHGTMFSLINRRPFAVIGPHDGHSDRRIGDVLESLGLSGCYFPANKIPQTINTDSPYTEDVEKNIRTFVHDSKQYLKDAINNSKF
jgi:hypothetical protein